MQNSLEASNKRTLSDTGPKQAFMNIAAAYQAVWINKSLEQMQ
jgi:hypothetical protein